MINDIEKECTEYKTVTLTAKIAPAKPIKAYVDDYGIYIPSRHDYRCHELLISKELFVEAYNKWIKNANSNPFTGQDDADDWSED